MQRRFLSFGPSDQIKLRIKILDATLSCIQVELKYPLLLAQANVLGMKRKAHYPVTHIQIKTFTAISGAQQISIDNAFLGPIPQRILIALVKNTALVGSASRKAYHFQHYDMTNLVLYVTVFSFLPNHSLRIALHPLGLPGLTKYYFPVLVSITMTVLI